MCIPSDFELPGDRVQIRREGIQLVIKPVTVVRNLIELLAQWERDEPLGPKDQFPDITDEPSRSEDTL